MNGTPNSQPIPPVPYPLLAEYDSARAGDAPPRAAGSANGTLNVEVPVESCIEKLSPMPWIFPAPCGTEMALLDTPLLSAPVGSAVVVIGSMDAGSLAVESRSLSRVPIDSAAGMAVRRRAVLWDRSGASSSDSATLGPSAARCTV